DLVLELEDPVDERLGGRRAARHVDVDGHDAVAAADDGVGIMIVAAAVGAGAHRDHPARLRHLVVDLAQRRRHLVDERTGDDHDVRLARASAEDDAEAVQVVARGARVHHLDRAAGEAERHRPERAGARPVDQLVGGRGDEPLLQNAFNSHGLLPFQRALHPLVDEPHDQNAEEHHHREETEQSDVVDDRRPRKEERDLEVEQNEQDRHEVVAHVELHARVLERLEPAFVGRELLQVRAVRSERPAEDHRRGADDQADQDEQQDREVFCKHRIGSCASLLLANRLVPTSRLELLRLIRPLAPQASVSTNFTTWASPRIIAQFGTSFALAASPDAGLGASAPGFAASAAGFAACAAGFAASAPGFCGGCGTSLAGFSVLTASRIPLSDFGRLLAKYASARLRMKNTVASTAVVRDRKFADPVAPKRLADAPPPNPEPMSAPLPCWSSTSPMIARAITTCSTIITVYQSSMSAFLSAPR